MNYLYALILGIPLGVIVGLLFQHMAQRLITFKCNQRHRQIPNIDMGTKFRVVMVLVFMFLFSVIFLGMNIVPAIIACVIMTIAVTCTYVDSKLRIIPNEAVLALLVLGIAFRVSKDGFSSLLGSLGALAIIIAVFGGCAVFMKIKKGTPGVGAGDLKMAMVMAISVGFPGVLYSLGALAVSMIIYCFVGIQTRMMRMDSYFPMCLHLTVGLYAGLIASFLSALFLLLGMSGG